MNEISPGLFVGDKDDCYNAPSTMAHLCVLQPSTAEAIGCKGTVIQFVHERPDGTLHASAKALRRIARWIDVERGIRFTGHDGDFIRVNPGRPVLVHCAGGVERSPLAVAWYLGVWAESEYTDVSLEAAWRLVQEKRPQAQDRRFWLR